jgi:PAS domain S-box-containing protein
MIPFSQICLFSCFFSLIVGVILYERNPTHRINRMALLLSGVLFYWGFAQFEFLQASDAEVALFWMRVGGFWYVVPAVALDFVIVFTTIRIRRLIFCSLVYVPAFLLSLWEVLFTPYVSAKMPWGWDYFYVGYFGYVELLWVMLSAVAILLLIVRRYGTSKSDEEKIGVRYVFAGLLIPTVAGTISALAPFLTSVSLPDLTVPASALGFLLVGYAVLRHGMYVLTPSAAAGDILHAIADPLFLVNDTGEIITSNKAASQVFEYQTSEFVGKRLSALASDSNFLEAMLRNHSSHMYETELRTKHGCTIPVSISRSEITTKQGNLIGHVIISRDITERKRMEEALREGEDRLRAIFESVNAGIMIVDPKTHVIIDANPAAIDMVGAPKDNVIGSVCHKFVCPAEKGRCPITDLGQTVDYQKERLFLRANGETAPILKSVHPIILNGKEHLLESFIDISERKRMEERLLQSERLASIGGAAAMVGHDLRNPLQSTANTLYLARKLLSTKKLRTKSRR